MNDPTITAASDHSADRPTQDTSKQIADILLELGIVTTEQMIHARRVRDKLQDGYSLVKVLQELEYLDARQLREALRAHRQRVPLGSLLVELGYLKPLELRAALEAQQDPEFSGKRLGEILLEKHLVQEHQLIEVLADQLGFPHEEPSFAALDAELLRLLTPEWCQRHRAVPIRRDTEGVLVAFHNPLDPSARQAAEGAFGEVVAAISSFRAIKDTIKAFESSRQHARLRPVEVDEANITRTVDDLIVDALEAGASDIHIEPMRHQLRVRLRRDGILMLHKEMDLALAPRHRQPSQGAVQGRHRREASSSGRRFSVRRSPHADGAAMCAPPFMSPSSAKKSCCGCSAARPNCWTSKTVGLAPRMLERFMEDALGPAERGHSDHRAHGLRQDHHALWRASIISMTWSVASPPPRIRWNMSSTASPSAI